MQSGNSQVAMVIQVSSSMAGPTRYSVPRNRTIGHKSSSTDLERNFTLDFRLRVTCSREEMSCVHLHSDDENGWILLVTICVWSRVQHPLTQRHPNWTQLSAHASFHSASPTLKSVISQPSGIRFAWMFFCCNRADLKIRFPGLLRSEFPKISTKTPKLHGASEILH